MAAKLRLKNLGKVIRAAESSRDVTAGAKMTNAKRQVTLSRFFKRSESEVAAPPGSSYDEQLEDKSTSASSRKRTQSQSSPASTEDDTLAKKVRTSAQDAEENTTKDDGTPLTVSTMTLSTLSSFSAFPATKDGTNRENSDRRDRRSPKRRNRIQNLETSKNEGTQPGKPPRGDDPGEIDKKYTTMANRGALTPLEKQVLALKEKYPGAVLFIEVGYRYRFFDRDAEIASKELNICAFPEHNYVVASIPTHRFFVHARRLVAKGYKVGVVKQTETPAIKKSGSNKLAPFERKLTALYTKSTMIGEDLETNSGGGQEALTEFVANEVNNYLLCIYEALGKAGTKSAEIGIVAIQPSTGDILHDSFHDNSARQELETRVQHIRPVEILLPEELSNETEKILKAILLPSSKEEERVRIERLPAERFDKNRALDQVASFFLSGSENSGGDSLHSVLRLPPPVVSCLAALTHYLREFQLDRILQQTWNMQPFTDSGKYMKLNACALQNLEIFSNQVDGTKRGSLFWVIDHTRTNFGRRELHRWLSQPLTDVSAINQRLDAVAELMTSDFPPLATLSQFLAKSPDLEKGICCIYHKKCSPAEFVRILSNLDRLRELGAAHTAYAARELKSSLLLDMFTEVPVLLEDVSQFCGSLNQDAAKSGDKTKLFRDPDRFPALRACKQEIARITSRLEEHLARVRSILKMPSLNFTSVSGYEYLIEVKNSSASLIPNDWKRINMTKKFSRFRPPFVEETFTELCIAREKLVKASEEAWLQFMDLFAQKFGFYRRAIKHLATYDCLLSLSDVAKQDGYCRPEIYDSPTATIQIKDGKHPVVSALLGEGEQYVPNSTHLQGDQERFMNITGPNMGGKSSYLKQVALIVILAQMGSYVPAEEATITPMDAVFTRMGASDNIFKNRSTFMTELSEASTILSEASPRSLVILDELGRGTSTHDGVAIAYAAAKYIVTEVKCLTLFVTHYPPLAELAQHYPREVGNYHMAFLIDEEENEGSEVPEQPAVVTFLYQLVAGAASRSYGINVARMADLPATILALAAQKSRELEQIVSSKRERRQDFLEAWRSEKDQVKQLLVP